MYIALSVNCYYFIKTYILSLKKLLLFQMKPIKFSFFISFLLFSFSPTTGCATQNCSRT